MKPKKIVPIDEDVHSYAKRMAVNNNMGLAAFIEKSILEYGKTLGRADDMAPAPVIEQKSVGRPPKAALTTFIGSSHENRYRKLMIAPPADREPSIMNVGYRQEKGSCWYEPEDLLIPGGKNRPAYVIGALVMAGHPGGDMGASVHADRIQPLYWFNGRENLVEVRGQDNEWAPANEMAEKILALHPGRPTFSNALLCFLYADGGFCIRYL